MSTEVSDDERIGRCSDAQLQHASRNCGGRGIFPKEKATQSITNDSEEGSNVTHSIAFEADVMIAKDHVNVIARRSVHDTLGVAVKDD